MQAVNFEFVEEIIATLIDPISLELMADPVSTIDNHTYDRDSIEKWFTYCEDSGRPYTSPVSNDVLSSKEVRPNIAVKSILNITIKYLDGKESLDNYTQRLLAKYKEREAERNLEVAEEIGRELQFSTMRVLCRRQHNMIYLRRNRLPTEYAARSSGINIACDLCHHPMIHREPHNFYYHCGPCNFDVCDSCLTAEDCQERINSSSSPELPLGDPFSDEFAFLEWLLMERRRIRTESSVFPTALVPQPPRRVQQPPQPVDRTRRPSMFSRFTRMISNSFRSSGNDDRSDEFICPRGHRMVSYLGRVPPTYETAMCDACAAERLENNGEEYYHCPRCSIDMCGDCAVLRMQQRNNR